MRVEQFALRYRTHNEIGPESLDSITRIPSARTISELLQTAKANDTESLLQGPAQVEVGWEPQFPQKLGETSKLTRLKNLGKTNPYA